MKKFLFLLLSVSTLFAMDFIYPISKKELRTELYKQFPISKRALVTQVVLSEPFLDFQKNRIIIHTTITLPSISDKSHQPLQARVKLSAQPKLQESNKIYLQDVQVIDIQNCYLSLENKHLLIFSLKLILNAYFQKHVAYTINYKNFNSKLVSTTAKYLDSIEITPDALLLHFKIY